MLHSSLLISVEDGQPREPAQSQGCQHPQLPWVVLGARGTSALPQSQLLCSGGFVGAPILPGSIWGAKSALCWISQWVMQSQLGGMPEGVAFPPVQGWSLGLPFTPALHLPHTQRAPLFCSCQPCTVSSPPWHPWKVTEWFMLE